MVQKVLTRPEWKGRLTARDLLAPSGEARAAPRQHMAPDEERAGR